VPKLYASSRIREAGFGTGMGRRFVNSRRGPDTPREKGKNPMRILVRTAVLALAAGLAAAQTAPAEPKNYSIDPWHINVPKPVANPVTGVTRRFPVPI